jgi:hypothetical protein
MKPQKCLWAAIFSGLLLLRASAATLYVSLESTNPIPPYAGWSTAATNIQNAIDAAGTGDRILVDDGIYSTGGVTVSNMVVSNRVAVTKAVTVQSVNGPAVTVIDGGSVYSEFGGLRCVYLASGATLTGFSIIGGEVYESPGAGVWCESTSSTVSNCMIYSNRTDTASGSFYSRGAGANGGTLNNCTLTGNAAFGFGGGAAFSTLNNCILSNNFARWSSGGAESCTLNNCTLTGNHSGDTCGGAGGCTLNNCTLTSNSGFNVGGGAVGSTLTNCTLTGNDASQGGGAWYCTLNNCTLTGNSGLGGGAADCTLFNCTLTGNIGYSQGGGARGSTLYNCTLTSNSLSLFKDVSGGGGAEQCTLYNCVLTGNSAVFGGGAAASTLYNCTLAANSADVGGGVGQDQYGNLSILYNCILFYNSDTNTGNYDASSTLNYCCTTPLPPSGVGNITGTPLFVDTNGWSNLRLQPGSPCINAGNNNYVSTTTDLDGNPRILGGTVDMGAYEFWTPALLVERLIGLVNESGIRRQQPLLATLEAALASLQRGNAVAAANQLLAFQNKVRAQVGPTNPDLEEVLNVAAQQVIAAITPNSNP